jgi:cytochrome P450
VQRASKTLSFTPLVPDITRRVLGLDDDTVAIVRQHIDPDPGEPKGFLADIHDLVYSYFGPGEALNELSFDAASELAKQVNSYARTLQGSRDGEDTVNLLTWVRHFVAIATAQFLYGDENPLALHPELEAAFWDFDHGLGGLLMGILPSITARKAYRGREALARAFEEYLTQNRHLPGPDGRRGASPIILKRVSIALQHGWTLRAAARSEVSFLFAGIVNTATITFWLVLHLFASADLLATVRADLAACLTLDESESEGGTKSLTVDLTALKTCSPTLASLLRESLRYTSDNYSTRLVKSPTTLPGGYHLVANAVVQIAGGTMHADTRIWGPDAAVFNPLRFFSTPSTSSSKSSSTTTVDKVVNDDAEGANQSATPSTTATAEGRGTQAAAASIHPAAFRAFGGGKTLCPGRHFATTEITALVAMLVARFDISAAATPSPAAAAAVDDEDDDNNNNNIDKTKSAATAARRRIEIPGKEDGVMPVHVLEPKKDVMVKVRVREGMEGVADMGVRW